MDGVCPGSKTCHWTNEVNSVINIIAFIRINGKIQLKILASAIQGKEKNYCKKLNKCDSNFFFRFLEIYPEWPFDPNMRRRTGKMYLMELLLVGKTLQWLWEKFDAIVGLESFTSFMDWLLTFLLICVNSVSSITDGQTGVVGVLNWKYDPHGRGSLVKGEHISIENWTKKSLGDALKNNQNQTGYWVVQIQFPEKYYE